MDNLDENTELDIAVIGIAGRFPQAENIEKFWQNLCEGKESIRHFSDEELKQAGYNFSMIENPHLIKAASVLDDIELFDAGFFGYSPREAEQMDPQQRIFLECAWEALEDGGCNPETFPGIIGVFAGTAINTYVINNINLQDNKSTENLDGLQLTIGNDKDYLTTRISYKLNLNGPSVCVQTACSTSLVSVHLACQSLLNYECDAALAGGISVRSPQPLGYIYQEGSIMSPDGHCRTFDADSKGTIFGNGAGVVLLKRLSDAVKDKDNIYAVIKGTAINNDGSRKVGYTAPSVDGQVSVIKRALATAGVSPKDISFLEAHGTATPLGDMIEITALKQVFGAHKERNSCAVGSVKTNVGHLDTAAGIAGLIKTILSLYHKEIPPSLHFEKPNPELGLEESPFYVNTHLKKWSDNGKARFAGISSFGIGGTNAHAVLQEAPVKKSSESNCVWHLLPLSAKSDVTLENYCKKLKEHLEKHSEHNLADVTYTLQKGRKFFDHRTFVLARNSAEAIENLTQELNKESIGAEKSATEPEVVFMFPGQGSQYYGMAKTLYENEPFFRGEIDRCADILFSELGIDLRNLMFDWSDGEAAATDLLKQTVYTQPALFSVEYALAKLLLKKGIRPSAMIGHSLGEFVAACLSEVMSLEDALKTVALRGKLMQSMPHGEMLAVALSEQNLSEMLPSSLSLAAVNGKELCVVSGEKENIRDFAETLKQKNIFCQTLNVSHAYHSAMMNPALEPFLEHLKTINLGKPKIPFISNVSADFITEREARDPQYWTTHLRSTVRFADGLQNIPRNKPLILLEVGPSHSLTKIAGRERLGDNVTLIPVLEESRSASDADKSALSAIGKLWSLGVEIDWNAFYENEKRTKVSLPTYQFDRQSYWMGSKQVAQIEQKNALRKNPLEKWSYYSAWKQSLPVAQSAIRKADNFSVLVFSDESEFCLNLIEKLKADNYEVFTVSRGEKYEQTDNFVYKIDASQPDNFEKLFSDLAKLEKIPQTLIHTWSLKSDDFDETDIQTQTAVYNGLIFLGQAIGLYYGEEKADLYIITDKFAKILPNEKVNPAKALLTGPTLVLPLESLKINTFLIDAAVSSEKSELEELVELVSVEIQHRSPSNVIAYRGTQRWVRQFDNFQLTEINENSPFKNEGVYVITGGLGELGTNLAKHLGENHKAKLVIVMRTVLPSADEWNSWLENNDSDNEVSQKILQIRELEQLGAEVLIRSADVKNQAEIEQIVKETIDKFGKIDGVFHLAGIPGGGLIQTKDDGVPKVFSPKIDGTLSLCRAMEGQKVDFIVLFSSITSITGALGQVDYSSACAFMNSFAEYYQDVSKVRTVSVAWDAWKNDSWQQILLKDISDLQKAVKEHREKYGISLDEGFEVLRRALQTRLPQIIISTQNLTEVIENQRKFSEKLLSQKMKSYRSEKTSENGISAAPQTETEITVARIWREVLGVEEISVSDNFISLGGHSLLAVQLLAKLREEFKADFPLKVVFEKPTVREMAYTIEKYQEENNQNDSIEKLLAEIENLSEEEVQSRLASLEASL